MSTFDQRGQQVTYQYIAAGDIFQANLTQRFVNRMPPGLGSFDLYRRLRDRAPAPYAAYFNAGGGCALASASPECFLKIGSNRRIETRPIKGTRPRGSDPLTDAKLAEALLDSEED